MEGTLVIPITELVRHSVVYFLPNAFHLMQLKRFVGGRTGTCSTLRIGSRPPTKNVIASVSETF
jgi:hypothetical protein